MHAYVRGYTHAYLGTGKLQSGRKGKATAPEVVESSAGIQVTSVGKRELFGRSMCIPSHLMYRTSMDNESTKVQTLGALWV